MQRIYMLSVILTTVSYNFAKYYCVLKVDIVLYREEETINMRSITFYLDLVYQLTHFSVELFIHRNY
jgi:hypothetical protein